MILTWGRDTQVIFRQGTVGREVYLIEQGDVILQLSGAHSQTYPLQCLSFVNVSMYQDADFSEFIPGHGRGRSMKPVPKTILKTVTQGGLFGEMEFIASCLERLEGSAVQVAPESVFRVCNAVAQVCIVCVCVCVCVRVCVCACVGALCLRWRC